MNRRFIFFLLVWILALSLSAQPATINSGWRMRYVKSHHLMSKGAETNVVDMDLEWPDEIDFQDVEPLRAYLCQTIFDVQATTLPAAYKAFMRQQGTEVSRTFDTLPDDSKFCYSTLKLKYLGGETNRFASFRVSANIEPQPNSSQKARQVESLITYDLLSQRVLTAKELLRNNSTSFGQWVGEAYRVSFFTETDQYSALIKECCLMDSGNLLAFLLDDEGDDGTMLVAQTFPNAFAKSFFSKDAKRLLKAKITGSKPLATISPEVRALLGQYDMAPDTPATADSLKQTSQDIIRYIAGNFQLPEGVQHSNGTVTAYVGFVLDSTGYVKEPCILKSMGPAMDQELVKTLLMMPRQKPIVIDGRKKSAVVQIPFRIRFQ